MDFFKKVLIELLSFNETLATKFMSFVCMWFNLMARKNELKKITKHISCECKCKFDGKNCNSNQI